MSAGMVASQVIMLVTAVLLRWFSPLGKGRMKDAGLDGLRRAPRPGKDGGYQ